jgi:hypothetical protein
VGSSGLMQFQESHGASPFDSPYFSIWFNHSVTGLCCFAVAVAQSSFEKRSIEQKLASAKFTQRQAMIESAGLATVFQLFNVCWAASMSAGTPVSVFMAISQSSCVPVLVLSYRYCFLHEKLTFMKLLAVWRAVWLV